MFNFLSSVVAAAEGSKPAGGAEMTEVVAATGGALIATAALIWLAAAHRSGRSDLLRRAAGWASRQTGQPSWVALPTLMATTSLLIALIGMYWDISLHIDDGRDAGPLANPAHYFILFGLFGIFAAGLIAVALPEGKPSKVSVRIAEGWYAPLGGIVLLSASSFALAGFPLDDMWHRLFGQDVTLWGPTHLMLIGGAGLTLLGHAVLLVEGGRDAAVGSKTGGFMRLVQRTRFAGVCGGLLIGLSTFQGEFDFGVPQFRLVFQPVLIAFAAGIALTAARIYTGRGGALIAVAYFWVIRGLVSLLVGPVLGETTPHLPLYFGAAIVVELVALRVATDRPYRFGAIAGLGIGTIGIAAEWAWSHVWMPNPWPEGLLGEALLLVPVTGVAAGVIGGFVGTALAAPLRPERISFPRPAPAAVGLVLIAIVVGYGLQVSPEKGVRAELTTSAPQGKDRFVDVTARITPPEAAEDPNWLTVIGWQGQTKLVLQELKQTGPGVFRTSEPVPAGGSWKTMVRLHKDDSLLSAPIYLPEDKAIPAKGIPLETSTTREFIYDHDVLQREKKKGVSTALPLIAYGIVGLIALGFVGILGWSLTRLARAFAEREPHSSRKPRERVAR